jgi:hypothetical protein
MLRFTLLIFATLLVCELAQADQKAAAQSKPQASGQTICSINGTCRPVKPGCHIVNQARGKQKEVCP